MNKKSTFAERAGLLANAAEYLGNILTIVENEAKAMAEAQERFEAKTASRRSAKSTE